MSGKSSLIKILAGGAIGSVITMLFAPKRGKLTRNGIKIKTDEYFDDAEKIINDAQKKAQDIINEGMRKSEELISNAKDKVEDIFSRSDNNISQSISRNKASSDIKLHKSDFRNSAKNKELVDITKFKTGFRNNKVEHRDKRHKGKFD